MFYYQLFPVLTCNNTRYWGNILYYFEEIHSTHLYANELSSKSRPTEGTVILADYQRTGRGQREKIWQSPPGKNLLFSSILYPTHLNLNQVFMMNVVASLAICDVFDHYSTYTLKIKWPNDLYFRSKKMAGILIQSSVKQQDQLEQLILSIGLNVNQVVWPKELNATSMAVTTGRALDRQEVFNRLCEALENRYEQLKSKYISKMMSDYNERLFHKNRTVEIRSGNEWNQVTLLEVRPDGSLICRDEHDGIQSYHMAKVDSVKFDIP